VTLHPLARDIVDNVERVLLGKTRAVKLCLAALVSNGHVLLEDVPGVGKTVLARALAMSVGATFTRIQFTPDLLPGDITGIQIYDQEARRFEFRPGPIMTQVLLADEINRATPKTQSALLESMDERRVTVDGAPHDLPLPFLVLATQNPIEFEGTFPLPESQLDRFLISLKLGYPDREHELRMLLEQQHVHPIDDLRSVASVSELVTLQRQARDVYVDDLMRGYLLDVIDATRRHPDVRLGGSPRATLALFQMTQAWALIHDRHYALPDDVKTVAGAVLRHRIVPSGYLDGQERLDQLVASLVGRIPVPGNRA
jgi:MoxR-like ATPase